jgi:hypothetical protein
MRRIGVIFLLCGLVLFTATAMLEQVSAADRGVAFVTVIPGVALPSRAPEPAKGGEAEKDWIRKTPPLHEWLDARRREEDAEAKQIPTHYAWDGPWNSGMVLEVTCGVLGGLFVLASFPLLIASAHPSPHG